MAAAPVSKSIPGAVIWLLLSFFLFWALRFVAGGWGSLFFVLQVLTVFVLVAVALPLLWRFIHLRLLWSLNSRLVLTYLLFGLAPIVLFGTLVFFAAYLAAGQFAIHLADSRVQDELSQMSTANAHRISQMILALAGGSRRRIAAERCPARRPQTLSRGRRPGRGRARAHPHRRPALPPASPHLDLPRWRAAALPAIRRVLDRGLRSAFLPGLPTCPTAASAASFSTMAHSSWSPSTSTSSIWDRTTAIIAGLRLRTASWSMSR